MLWKNTPALAPALGLLIGCATAPRVMPCHWGWLAALCALGWLAVAVAKRPWGIAVAALAAGWWLGSGPVQQQRSMAAAIDLARPLLLEGQVVSQGSPDETAWRFLLRARSVDQGAGPIPFEERVWVRIPGPRRPLLGDRLSLRGYLRRGSTYANSPEPPASPWSLYLKSERLLRIHSQRPEFWDGVVAVQRQVDGACQRLADRRWIETHTLAWLRALLLGQRGDLPLSERQGLKRSGLAHLVAVSGLHLGLIFGGFYGLGFWLPWRLRLVLAALGMLVYASLLGAQASVWRAGLMGVLMLSSLVLSRPPNGRNGLAVAVILLLLDDPRWVFDLGFCLSVAATAGILWWAPAWASWPHPPLRSVPRWLRTSFAATLAAQVATLPWTLGLHGGIHPIAPLLNLLALPWLAAFLGLGLLAAVAACSPLTLPLAWLPAQGLDLLAQAPAWLASRAVSVADWQPWSVAWPLLMLWVVGAMKLLAIWGRQGLSDGRSSFPVVAPGAEAHEDARRQPAPWRLRSGWPLWALLVLAQGPQPSPTATAIPELLMIDVGQGDAFLLRDGDRAVLIDGGGWRRGDFGGRVLLPLMASQGLRRLDGVMISHGDTDHCAGVRDLLRYLPVGQVWTTANAEAKGCLGEVLAISGPRWRPLWRGDVLAVGRWQLRILHPRAGEAIPSANEGSLAVQASVHGRRLLFTGDLEKGGERRLLTEDVASDVLKVGHHGSKTSTGETFLRRVRPRLALISAGVSNVYGHPSVEVTRRLRRRGVVLLRSDLSGLVRLRFPADGPLEIETPGAPRAESPAAAR